MRWKWRQSTTRDPDPGAIEPPLDEHRRAAFTEFYDAHAAAILRYCQVRIDNPHDAEDVAAQVFAQAWRAFPPDDRGSPRSWLFTIAHNNVVNFYRRQGVRGPTRPLDDPRAQAVPDGADSPEDAWLRRESISTLHGALALLPPDQLRVVELRLAGLTGAEIADVIGRSEGAVKMIQFRAMGRLRQHFMPDSRPAADQPAARREHADASN